jgi:glutathione S-transferase
MQLRESMSFNLTFFPAPPAATPEALAEAGEILSLWETALASNREPGPFLFGAFGAADIMFAPVVWRLTAFGVGTTSAPRAAAYMKEVLSHPAVKRWMDPARALPPVQTY